MHIVVVGLNHRSAPVDVRERLAFTPAKLDFALTALRGVPGLAEGVIVSTCNRVEIYGTGQTPREAISGIESFLHSYHGVDQRLEREI
ncbi:MAG: glutamyl-tRNA reductase, partial [Verrucomicrobia bacterium]|nr:glutamyl-tRNA reductase [Verrucomicrobiota bacterium]